MCRRTRRGASATGACSAQIRNVLKSCSTFGREGSGGSNWNQHADHQFRPDDGPFAMRSLPSKFFWLCGECAKTHIVKRWTTSGLVVVLRNQNTADSPPDLAARPATTADVPSGPDAQQLTPPAALIVAPNISPSSVISPSLQRICR